MQPGQVTFGHYSGGNIQLVIPRYQRPYEWTLERWVDLWRDIAGAYRARVASASTASAHFMGPVILEDSGTHPGGVALRRHVVDGQQRLLTLFVLRAAIRDHDAHLRQVDVPETNDLTHITPQFGEDPIERVELEKTYRPVYAAIAQGDFVEEIPSQFSGDALAKAYAFFRFQLWSGMPSVDNYDPQPPPRASRRKNAPHPGSYEPWGAPEEKNGIDLPVLAGVLATGLKLLELVLDSSDEQASVIFETMNSKNTPLRQFDHLRNSIYVCMPRRRDSFHKNRWSKVEDTLSGISYSSLRNSPEEQFLYEYVISLSEGRVNAKNLHRTFMERVYRDLGYPPRDEKRFESEYATPVAQAALIYPLALGKAREVTVFRRALKIPKQAQITNAELLLMSGGPPVPVILKLLLGRFENQISDQDLVGCVKDIQSYLVRAMLKGDSLSPLRSTFMQVCQAMGTDVSRKGLQSALRKVGWAADSEVESEVARTDLYSYGGTQMFPILRGIERQIAKTGAHQLPYGSGSNEYTIEHVFPQSQEVGKAWAEDLKTWGPKVADAAEMYQRRHVLGNLTAVTQYDNAKNGRKSFTDKKRLIRGVAPIRLNDSVLSQRRWTPQVIDKRTELLCKAALKEWPAH